MDSTKFMNAIKIKEEIEKNSPIEFKDEFVFQLSGDYNDADYTYCTVRVPLFKKNEDDYEVDLKTFVNALSKSTGKHKWEDKYSFLNDDEINALDEVSLYSDNGECHTMEIDSIIFESSSGKSYNITIKNLLNLLK